MDKQTVTTAGMIASVNQSFTREKKAFASAILEDLTGSIEVMVWPRVYADTTELWQEGNIVLVEGKVRIRDDKPQLACDRVTIYQPDKAPEDTPAVPSVNAALPLAPQPQPVDAQAVENLRLVINLEQTDDKEKDNARLRNLAEILKEYPGAEDVILKVSNGEKTTVLKLTQVSFSKILADRLASVAGEGRVRREAVPRKTNNNHYS
jgi:DNA polymerase-3 subunit alpha